MSSSNSDSEFEIKKVLDQFYTFQNIKATRPHCKDIFISQS